VLPTESQENTCAPFCIAIATASAAASSQTPPSSKSCSTNLQSPSIFSFMFRQYKRRMRAEPAVVISSVRVSASAHEQTTASQVCKTACSKRCEKQLKALTEATPVAAYRCAAATRIDVLTTGSVAAKTRWLHARTDKDL
jgi:hypothetical protein